MNRDEIKQKIYDIFEEEFEISGAKEDEDLREVYEFDSIDAIDLIGFIEEFIGFKISNEDKKKAIDVRTIGQIIDYVDQLVQEKQAS